jgi:hypothetical protein
MVDEHPMFEGDPRYAPGGMYWHKDLPDYDKIRAEIAEFLAFMLWEEVVALRDGSVPEGYGITPEARWQNIRTFTNQYRFWAKKDLRPRGLWNQEI